jgi:hypothetical protein
VKLGKRERERERGVGLLRRPCRKSRASRGRTACSSRCCVGSTLRSVPRRGRGWRRSGCGRRTRSRSSARRGDWRCTRCSTRHQSSSSRRSAWFSPTSCTSRGNSLRMRRRLARSSGGTMTYLIRRRLVVSSARHFRP